MAFCNYFFLLWFQVPGCYFFQRLLLLYVVQITLFHFILYGISNLQLIYRKFSRLVTMQIPTGQEELKPKKTSSLLNPVRLVKSLRSGENTYRVENNESSSSPISSAPAINPLTSVQDYSRVSHSKYLY